MINIISTNTFKQNLKALLKSVDVGINGKRPWDMKIKNEIVFKRILQEGSLGLGEAYMDGEWDCESLDEFFNKLLRGSIDKKIKKNLKLLATIALSKIINHNSKEKSFEVGEHHYDIGNDLFKLMLDKRMVYTCGYWKNAKNLDQAQEDKLDLVCKKIGLKPGMRVLDIGGGWGSFAKFAAEKYKVNVVNVTVSKEQIALANKLCKGLPVENRLQDYRDIKGQQFDRVVSLGMFEHVNYKNYKTFMEIVSKNLKEDGLFLLHTLGGNISVTHLDPWTKKYIFPNSLVPSMKQITTAYEGLFVMEDWHNFGQDYDKTLMTWFENFDKNWPKLKTKYSKRFYRMWTYWLLSCAGAFRSRNLQLWQIVFSKKGIVGGYKSIR